MVSAVMQLQPKEFGWAMFYKGVRVANAHLSYNARRRDYLFFESDGVWHRWLIEMLDNTGLNQKALIEMFIGCLRRRGFEIGRYEFRPDCTFSVDADGVYLLSRKRVIAGSKKPLNEFVWHLASDPHRRSESVYRKLSNSLRHDYKQFILIDGTADHGHRSKMVQARGYSYQNHSLYLKSLHIEGKVIAKLYDSVPQYSHLHGLVLGRFMRRPFAYAVVYRDVPEHVLVNRIKRALENYYGIQFSKRHLEVCYAPIKGSITPEGSALIHNNRGHVMAACTDGYYLNRREIRDRMYLGGLTFDLHLSNYPNIRRIFADHIETMVRIEQENMLDEEPGRVSFTALQYGGMHLRPQENLDDVA